MATQREVAAHLSTNEHAIRELVKLEVIPAGQGRGGYSLDACRVAYIKHLRSQIADPTNTDQDAERDAAVRRQQHVDDINKERARQAAETADKLAMENAQRRREVAPVTELRDAAAKMGSLIRQRLETLPAQMKRRLPFLRAADLMVVKQEITKLSDELASINISNESSSGGNTASD